MRIHESASTPAKVEQQMTPMIDVVFQLLVFFVMSFRIASLEGDFAIKMPVATRGNPDMHDPVLTPLKLRVQSDSSGNVAAVTLNGRSFEPGDWQSIQHYLAELLLGAADMPPL